MARIKQPTKLHFNRREYLHKLSCLAYYWQCSMLITMGTNRFTTNAIHCHHSRASTVDHFQRLSSVH